MVIIYRLLHAKWYQQPWIIENEKADVLNFSGATSTDILTKNDDALDKKPESNIIHVDTNDLTNDVNLLSNVKKIGSKTSRTSPNTSLSLSNIIFRKDKRNIEKTRADTNSRLNNFCKGKNITLLSNDNFKKEHLGVKKLHLNIKGNSIFAKNLLQFIEGDWDFSPLEDSYTETEHVRNISTTIVLNAISTLQENSW